MIDEDHVVVAVSKFLKQKGYLVRKKANQHGADIATNYHKKYRRQYVIEAKGDAGRKPTIHTSYKHYAFYMMLGQILSRMNYGGNDEKKGRRYALAIPAHWQQMFQRKINDMPYGWRLLKLRVFLVNEKGGVTEVTYNQFLKKRGAK
jgi:hypothetical protein